MRILSYFLFFTKNVSCIKLTNVFRKVENLQRWFDVRLIYGTIQDWKKVTDLLTLGKFYLKTSLRYLHNISAFLSIRFVIILKQLFKAFLLISQNSTLDKIRYLSLKANATSSFAIFSCSGCK